MKLPHLSGIMGLVLLGFYSYAQIDNSKTKMKEMTKMKEFSLLVRVPLNYSTEQAKAVGPEWTKVIDNWKKEGVYVYSFAFPGESYVVAGVGKLVKKEPVVANNLRVVSNVILRASGIENALKLAKDCPILVYGGSVEVREIPSRATFPIEND
ncbi:YciI family protein [Olivibacter domesticus]|uniref:Uncharacterized protein n=1 Tax=Olivibacter domesticus TaxID=407022 RepID=A0A1H7HGI7_OLID1|nr:hypothetical protein [Olivibacter domesticus]SEK49411.1 hypothetical protein SAMN05661044_00375 [Olivibacter domesticus]